MASASAVGRMLPLSRLNASSAFVERVPSTSGFVVTAHSYFFLRLLATSSSKSFYGCDISSFVTHFFLLHSKPSITKVNRNPPSFASLDGGVGLVRGGCPRLHLLPHALPDLPFQFASPWQILNDVADTPLPLVQPTTGTLRELRPEPTQSSSDLRTQPPSPTQERYASASNFANLPKIPLDASCPSPIMAAMHTDEAELVIEPTSPIDALFLHGHHLTDYEREEILDFRQVSQSAAPIN